MTETDKTERVRFEAWFNSSYIGNRPSNRHVAWEAWQARAALDTGAALAIDADLVQRCREVFDWMKTGLLCGGEGGALRAFADTRPGNTRGDVRHAENVTLLQAAEALVSLATPQPPASASAGKEPVAWVNKSYLDSIIEHSGKVYWHAPMMCGTWFAGAFPIYTAPQPPASVCSGKPQPVAVPAGWKLVPEEPTPEMLRAGSEAVEPDYGMQAVSEGDAAAIWSAMLAAAVPPPAESGEVEGVLRAALDFYASGKHAYGDIIVDHGEKARSALASTPAPQPGGAERDDSDDWYSSVQLEEIERPDRLTPPVQHSRGADKACMVDVSVALNEIAEFAAYQTRDELSQERSSWEIVRTRALVAVSKLTTIMSALSPSPSGWDAGAEAKDWRHIANEWADTATNGLQWLKNIRDGISTAEDAIANMQDCIKHCQDVAKDPTPPAGEG